ncbi:MAG: hypothetical protein ACFFG0_39935 [Candidatus Thorarchaeota archaeon]
MVEHNYMRGMMRMATTDYKFPWEWTHEYLKDRVRKNFDKEKKKKNELLKFNSQNFKTHLRIH